MEFGKLFKILNHELAQHAFEPLSHRGGDRHGDWEWVWKRPQSQQRVDFVIADVIDRSGAGLYGLEIWCGAEEGNRFGRFLVRSFPAGVVRPDGVVPDSMRGLVGKAVADAAQMAVDLPSSQLTGVYPDYARAKR